MLRIRTRRMPCFIEAISNLRHQDAPTITIVMSHNAAFSEVHIYIEKIAAADSIVGTD